MDLYCLFQLRAEVQAFEFNLSLNCKFSIFVRLKKWINYSLFI